MATAGEDSGRTSEVIGTSDVPSIIIAAVPTPIGRVYLAATPAALVAVQLPGNNSEVRLNHRLANRFPAAECSRGMNFVLKKTAAQLGEYFTGRRRTFSIQLLPVGTRFQLAVWQEVARIPFAVTSTYATIARAIHEAQAVRAVGAAQRANPFPILVPCHRVIGSDGRLVGYEGGLRMKRWLLDHEQKSMKRAKLERSPDAYAVDPGRPRRPKTVGSMSVSPRRIV